MKPYLDGAVPSTLESKTEQGFCQLMVMEMWTAMVIFFFVCFLASYEHCKFYCLIALSVL
jgi:hypothetical protein